MALPERFQLLSVGLHTMLTHHEETFGREFAHLPNQCLAISPVSSSNRRLYSLYYLLFMKYTGEPHNNYKSMLGLDICTKFDTWVSNNQIFSFISIKYKKY